MLCFDLVGAAAAVLIRLMMREPDRTERDPARDSAHRVASWE